jgi:hypothetical protein
MFWKKKHLLHPSSENGSRILVTIYRLRTTLQKRVTCIVTAVVNLKYYRIHKIVVSSNGAMALQILTKKSHFRCSYWWVEWQNRITQTVLNSGELLILSTRITFMSHSGSALRRNSGKCFRTQGAITSVGLHARDQITVSSFLVYRLHAIKLVSAVIKALSINQFVYPMWQVEALN